MRRQTSKLSVTNRMIHVDVLIRRFMFGNVVHDQIIKLQLNGSHVLHVSTCKLKTCNCKKNEITSVLSYSVLIYNKIYDNL